MSTREQWLKELKVGNLVIESTATSKRTVRIYEITRNKIYYTGFYGELSHGNFVLLNTGYDSSLSRTIIPVGSVAP